MRYDDAVASLFQVPLDQFVTERKRLAGELKAAGDKTGAAKLGKLARPPISAWVVDQLWWHTRAAFEALFETARRLRNGERDATAAHRDALTKLRVQATKILTEAGHGATEATLRRVTLTLSALAAAGGWDPDLPGALSADRDPPGFEAIGISNVSNVIAFPGNRDARPHATAEPARERDATETTDATEAAEADHGDDLRKHREAIEAQRRQELEAAAEARRAEAEHAKLVAERHRIEAALRTAEGDVAQREREVARLERDLATARSMVAKARATVADLEERLAQLDR